jgi:hypothetical protein
MRSKSYQKLITPIKIPLIKLISIEKIIYIDWTVLKIDRKEMNLQERMPKSTQMRNQSRQKE